MTPKFAPFPKMARLSREVVLTEKIDGTNASIFIAELANDAAIPAESMGVFDINGKLHYMLAGSRTRWITLQSDNHGFAKWVAMNFDELKGLGAGHHFGEWFGSGIQRGYGLKEKRFSLFNVDRWALYGTEPKSIATADPRVFKTQDVLPACCGLVPVLYRGPFCTVAVDRTIDFLSIHGSQASEGFMDPEGIVIYHVAGRVGFKKTIKDDDKAKGAS